MDRTTRIARAALVGTFLGALLLAPAAAAQVTAVDVSALPPGIQVQAEPLLATMMQHMQQMGMTPEQMEMMVADMQQMADVLPPGVWLQALALMLQLGQSEMMMLHEAVRSGGLLQQPSGVVLAYIVTLAR